MPDTATNEYLVSIIKWFSYFILEICSVAKSTAIKTCRIYQNSDNFSSKKRPGRPSKLDGRDIRHLVLKIKEDPTTTSMDLSRQVSEIKGNQVSSSCIRRNLLRIGLRSYAARKTAFLTDTGRKKRLVWCKKYQNRSIEFWRNVLFTDETIIELNPHSIINRVRRFSIENPYQMKYISPKIKHPLKIMFWAGISGQSKTNIIACNGIMNSERYISDVLDKEVTPLIREKPNLIFQQDNAPCHTSKKVKQYFLTKRYSKIDWPPNSPDLNIIENVWRFFKNPIE